MKSVEGRIKVLEDEVKRLQNEIAWLQAGAVMGAIILGIVVLTIL